jgi:hypothetical protein
MRLSARARRSRIVLAPSPRRRALLEEGARAFLGVVGACVHGHDGLGEGVGAVLVEFDLRVVGLLADADGEGLERAMASTRLATSSCASAGTTRLTRPQSSAVAASIGRPVGSMSSARLRPIARESGTIGVEQNSPFLTPGWANRALSAATARSQAATSWQPAAVAMPWTLAITDGEPTDRLHQLRADVEEALEERNVAADHLAEVVAGRECWAGGLRDDDPNAGIGADAPQRSIRSCMSSGLSALRFSGRLRVMRAAGSSWWTSTAALVASVLMAPTVRRLPSAGERRTGVSRTELDPVVPAPQRRCPPGPGRGRRRRAPLDLRAGERASL